MSNHTSRSLVFSPCSLLMGFLFAYSASVQLDDPDWYLWLPLYASASAINFLHIWLASRSMEMTASLTLLLGMVLFLKVSVEDYAHGLAGFWSMDMSERVVREKLGSGLVAASMLIHLKASPAAAGRRRTNRRVATRRCVDFGALFLSLSLHTF
uniref:Transmembrane protein 220 n=1 Tax=Anthurium amnicola TaxID=1678845 RepID=A0A1D1YV08_9ARAE